jgi:hypothetical protein
MGPGIVRFSTPQTGRDSPPKKVNRIGRSYTDLQYLDPVLWEAIESIRVPPLAAGPLDLPAIPPAHRGIPPGSRLATDIFCILRSGLINIV